MIGEEAHSALLTLAILGSWVSDAHKRLDWERLPTGWDVEFIASPADMSVREDLKVIAIPDTMWQSSLLDRLPALTWIHSVTAGVENLVNDARQMAHSCILTNSSGVYGQTIAEHCMGMMLTLARRLDRLALNKQERMWQTQWGEELTGSTVAVFGAGDIGGHIALRARGFGMKVLGYRRRPSVSDVGFDEVFGPESKDMLLRTADHVVLALPLTRDTLHFLGARELALVKPTARIYNVGRGALIDEDSLIAALSEGRIAGAALDVFATEPLPVDSPIWALDNVFISPHCSALSPQLLTRLSDILVDNMVRFQTGQPMLNRIEKGRH